MNNLKDFLKKSIPYLISGIVLLVLNVIMFYPQLEGKTKPSGDMNTYLSKTNETRKFRAETGEKTYWNASMFSGMPEHLLILGREQNVLIKVKNAFKLYMTRPIGLFIQVGLVCFISLCLLGLSPWVALVAAIVLSWNTNLLILYDAGHITKINVISFFPLIVCGSLLCFRGDFLKGAVSVALGTSLAILYDHIQMVYYLIFAMAVIGIVYLIYSLKDKTFSQFSKGAGIAIIAAAIAGLSNYGQLSSAKAFAEDTMRGKPILEKVEGQKAQSSSETQGLEWEYAMTWSNGVSDIFALFIPRFVGGSSGERVSSKSEAGKLMKRIGAKADKGKFVRSPGYWGSMPFTGGPSYFGASLILLFILSLFVIDPKLRWSILGVVAIYILFSMGKNASWLNKTFFDYMPLFNKFRAPNSILMSMPFFLVLPAFWGLHKIFQSEDKKQYLKPLFFSVGITGGLALFVMLLGGSLFDFIKPSELQYDDQVQSILRDARLSMQKSDSMRSLLFVLLTGGVLWAYLSGKIKNYIYILLGVAFLCVIDEVQVNKRYLKSYDFIRKSKFEAQFAPTNNDNIIFKNEPKGIGFYRVLDLSVNTFNDAKPSYHHHQIGGYDAAKLQRYQDMIDQYISKGNIQVLNMLNTKYIVTREGQVSPNPQAYGTAWFIKQIIPVSTAREEINAIASIGPDTAAVVLMNEFEGQNITAGNGAGNIELVTYQPNKMTYKSSSNSDQIAIFPEIWYGPNKGWKVTIDGQEVDHFRANYILRGLSVPKGDHEIIFEFKPEAKNGWISLVSSILILLVTFGAIGYQFRGLKP